MRAPARGATVLPARSLLDVCAHLSGAGPLQPYSADAKHVEPSYPELADVRGQAYARRALEVAAAGAHSLLSL